MLNVIKVFFLFSVSAATPHLSHVVSNI